MEACTQLQNRGLFELLEDKKKHFPESAGCTNTHFYRLVIIVQEATLLYAGHHNLIVKIVDCERKHL